LKQFATKNDVTKVEAKKTAFRRRIISQNCFSSRRNHLILSFIVFFIEDFLKLPTMLSTSCDDVTLGWSADQIGNNFNNCCWTDALPNRLRRYDDYDIEWDMG
jgi:hypothetical protein